MAEELRPLRTPGFWLFLNRLLWFWSLLAWGFGAILVTVKRPTWVPPVSLASRIWFSIIAVAGAAYLLSFRHKWHRWFGITANLALGISLLVAIIGDWTRQPTLSLLVLLPVVCLFVGVPIFLLVRGFGSAGLEPVS
jgi:hypothetical protein